MNINTLDKILKNYMHNTTSKVNSMCINYDPAYDSGKIYKAFSTFKYNSAVELMRMELRSYEFSSDHEQHSREILKKRAELLEKFFKTTAQYYEPKYDITDLNSVLSFSDISTTHGIYATDKIRNYHNYSGNDIEIFEAENKDNVKVIYTMYVNFNIGSKKIVRVYGDCLFECLETFMDILYDRKEELQD